MGQLGHEEFHSVKQYADSEEPSSADSPSEEVCGGLGAGTLAEACPGPGSRAVTKHRMIRAYSFIPCPCQT